MRVQLINCIIKIYQYEYEYFYMKVFKYIILYIYIQFFLLMEYHFKNVKSIFNSFCKLKHLFNFLLSHYVSNIAKKKLNSIYQFDKN